MLSKTSKPDCFGRTNKKTALFLIPCLLTGGTEVATLETSRVLKNFGYDVDIVVYFDEIDATILQQFESSNIRVTLLKKNRSLGVREHFSLAFGLMQIMMKRRYKLVWLQYMTPTLLPLIVVRFFSAKLVAAVHVASSHYTEPALSRIRWLTSWWCTQFVCVSHNSADGIFGVGEERSRFQGKVTVLPNPIDCQNVKSALARDWRREFGWSTGTVVIGFAGRLAYIKGPDILVESVARLALKEPSIRLVFVGDGAELPTLQKQAEMSGIAGITRFAGRLGRDEIYSAIKGFDIAVVPSREEGFGLSALEAMAAEVPLVATRLDALTEVVIDGETGLLFQPEEHEDLVFKIRTLIREPHLRTRLAKTGSQHADATYGMPNFRARLGSMMKHIGLDVDQVA